jgi:hypothetical protein
MKEIPFRIVGLSVDDFWVKPRVKLEEGGINISTSFSFGLNYENKLVRSIITYTYSLREGEVLRLTLSCIFSIEDTAFNGMQKDGKFILEPFLSQYLATINVGAARGEIHARCELANSELSKVVLPPINLVKALPEKIEIKI